MAITVIGKDSFLAQALLQHITNISLSDAYRFLDYKEALNNLDWLDSTNTLINFAFSPRMHKNGYEESEDIDLQLSHIIQQHPSISYVLMSSRKVYGPLDSGIPVTEDEDTLPDTPYGKAKKEIENRIQDILEESRITILRPANVFGLELGRQTFFGLALTNLRDKGVITYDFSPQTKKDFISSAYFANIVDTILLNPIPGTFNIGSGFSIECEKIALWLIEGFGSGRLEATQDIVRDNFELDMKKTYKTYGIKPYSQDSLRADCLDAVLAIKD